MKRKLTISADELVKIILTNYKTKNKKILLNPVFIDEYLNHHDETKHPYINLIDEYMTSRYDDGVDNIQELGYRLIHNIEKRPVCEYCGKRVKFNKFESAYNKYCCPSCNAHANKESVKEKNKVHLEERRKDPVKWTEYLDKLSKAGKKTWANKTPEELEKISKEITEWNNSVWADPDKSAKRKKNMKKRWDKRKAEWTEEERQEFSEKASKRAHDAWERKSEEEKEQFRQKQRDAWERKSEEEKAAWWNSVVTAKEEKGIPLFPTRNSEQETEVYEYLKSLYPLSKRWYNKDPRYDKYECDIYVPEKDAFIECQFFKTHGKHPYDPTNKDDIEFAEKLKQDSFCHYDYKTFTIRDPHKRKITKERNINFYEMWNVSASDYEKLNKWIINLPNVTQEEIDKRIKDFEQHKKEAAA